MNRRMVIVGSTWLLVMPWLLGCQGGGESIERAPMVAPIGAVDVSALPPSTPKPAGTSVTVYIKVVLERKYGLLAQLLGGKRNSNWESVAYDPANPWWVNPLVAYIDPPLLVVDAVGRADAEALTGKGSSANATIKVSLTPHADVAVKTIPASDAIKGTLVTNISTAAEFFDGEWVEMIRVADREVTFSFDTRDPLKHMEVIGHEARTIPAFAMERYTREHEKWEPRRNCPAKAKSGDWRVVIYAREAALQVTRFRYVSEPNDAAQHQERDEQD